MAAAVIVAVSIWLGHMTFKTTRRVMARTSTRGHVDLLVARFANACVVIVGVVVGLGEAGANVSALVASLGLAGLTIGLALRDVLANYVAGVMLLVQGPFRVGDSVIIDGIEGTIVDVTARATSMRGADGRDISVPNSTVFGATVTNLTTNPVRRFELSMTIPADADLHKACEAVARAISGTEGVLGEPAPDASITHAGLSFARVVAHGWVDIRGRALDAARMDSLSGAIAELGRAGIVLGRREQASRP